MLALIVWNMTIQCEDMTSCVYIYIYNFVIYIWHLTSIQND